MLMVMLLDQRVARAASATRRASRDSAPARPRTGRTRSARSRRCNSRRAPGAPAAGAWDRPVRHVRSRGTDRIQRAPQIALQVLRILDADRQPYEAVADAECCTLLRGNRRVRHDGRMLDQALHSAEALRERE